MDATGELKQVFADALKIAPDSDFAQVQYRAIPEWDSVAHMRLISAIENKFDVMLSTDDVLGMSSFEKAKEILKAHGLPISD